MPKKKMSDKMCDLLYDLAVDREKRREYFQNARKFLAKLGLPKEEHDLLVREAEREKKLIVKRQTGKGLFRRKRGEFERVYGKMFLPSTDDKNGEKKDDQQNGKKKR